MLGVQKLIDELSGAATTETPEELATVKKTELIRKHVQMKVESAKADEAAFVNEWSSRQDAFFDSLSNEDAAQSTSSTSAAAVDEAMLNVPGVLTSADEEGRFVKLVDFGLACNESASAWRISRACNRLSCIVDDLFDCGKLDQGSSSLVMPRPRNKHDKSTLSCKVSRIYSDCVDDIKLHLVGKISASTTKGDPASLKSFYHAGDIKITEGARHLLVSPSATACDTFSGKMVPAWMVRALPLNSGEVPTLIAEDCEMKHVEESVSFKLRCLVPNPDYFCGKVTGTGIYFELTRSMFPEERRVREQIETDRNKRKVDELAQTPEEKKIKLVRMMARHMLQ